MGFADDINQQSGFREGTADSFAQIIQNTHTANRRCRHNAAPIGFVVKRDIAGNDGKIERATRRAHAFQTTDKLPHNLGPFRIAEIQAIGNGKRRSTGGTDIAIGFGHGLPATGHGICQTIARGNVGGQSEGLVGAVNAHQRGVPAGADECVAHNH